MSVYSVTLLDRVWSGPHCAEVMFDGSVNLFLYSEGDRHRSVGRRLKKKAGRKFDRMWDEIVEQAEKNVVARNSCWDEALSRSL